MITNHDLQYAEVRLERWGAWVERHLTDNPYPQAYRIWDSIPGQRGHRILGADMPREVWRINQLVRRMPEQIVEVAYTKWVYVLDANGQQLTDRYKASVLEISESQYKRRVAKAKKLVAQNLHAPLDKIARLGILRDNMGAYALIKRVLNA